MNKLRELTEQRAKLLKEVSQLGTEIQVLQQKQIKEKAFDKAINYHQGEK